MLGPALILLAIVHTMLVCVTWVFKIEILPDVLPPQDIRVYRAVV